MPDSSIPDRPAIERALLEFLADGRVRNDKEIVAGLTERLGMGQTPLSVIGTGRTKFGNEIDWVKGTLGEWDRGKHLIRKFRPTHYQILPAGLTVIAELIGDLPTVGHPPA